MTMGIICTKSSNSQLWMERWVTRGTLTFPDELLVTERFWEREESLSSVVYPLVSPPSSKGYLQTNGYIDSPG